MKHLAIPISIYLTTSLIFASCNNTASTNNTFVTDTLQAETSISISPFDNPSPNFPEATLGIKDMKASIEGDSAIINISYSINNYELKSQTSDASTKGCNNSKDGQHIHFILNNGPYTALYEPQHTFKVKVDTENYVLSFLSRSYHESLKNKEAAQLLKIKVDAKGNISKLDIPNTPMIFFSRPKGDYVGAANTENVLLDYYLWNTDLISNNLKVKAQINEQTFNLDTWQPMVIKFAPMGTLNVTLSLIDSTGNILNGDNTTVSRTANLAQQEPVK